jgi:hypothetical protein
MCGVNAHTDIPLPSCAEKHRDHFGETKKFLVFCQTRKKRYWVACLQPRLGFFARSGETQARGYTDISQKPSRLGTENFRFLSSPQKKILRLLRKKKRGSKITGER